MAKKKVSRSDCPISQSLEVFGDKWSLLVIRDMLLNGKVTYGELLEMPEGIATNILADRLVSLGKAGVIRKEPHPGQRSKYQYRLGPMGIDLAPTLLEMILWGEKYFEISPKSKALARRAAADRQGVLKRLQDKACQV